MTATTFDLVRKVNHTLSGGNLVATSTAAGCVASSRVAQGKFYCEITPTTVTGTPQIGLTTSNSNMQQPLNGGVYHIGYLPSGLVQVNGVTVATLAAWAQGNRIDIACDPQARLVWFRVAGGNWNNDVIANQNPATGVGGIDYSASMTILSPMAAAIYSSLTGTVWTAVFSAAGWAGAAPAGFSSLDDVLYTLADNVYKTEEIAGIAPDTGVAVFCYTSARRFERIYNGTTITTVSGTVKELGVAVAGRVIEVYDRLTGELLGRTLSAGDGTWSINCLGRPNVRVVASDPTTFNSLVFDNVVPG